MLKLMSSRDSKIWSRFVFELVIWLNQVTFISWTQPSGRFALGNVFTHEKIAQKQCFKICVNKAWIINTKCVMSLLRLTQPPIKYANLQNLQNAKKHGFRIHWQKINTASPKNSIDSVWALFQHCDWQWYLDINKNDLKQDKVSNANSVPMYLLDKSFDGRGCSSLG